jgi:hypothetical protein
MKVDYLVGRLVTAVSGPEEDWKWSIDFEGDASIHYMGNVAIPSSEIDGATLGTVEISGSDTKMGFYGGSPAALIEEVTVSTTDLLIRPPGQVELFAITPVIDPEETRPPDIFHERVFPDGIGEA